MSPRKCGSPMNATGLLTADRTRNVDELGISNPCQSITMPIKSQFGRISNGRNKLQLTTQLSRYGRLFGRAPSRCPPRSLESLPSMEERNKMRGGFETPTSLSLSLPLLALRHCYKTAVHNLIPHLALHSLSLDPLHMRLLLFSLLQSWNLEYC